MPGPGIFGPYRRGSGWIILIRTLEGDCTSRRYRAEAEAQEEATILRAAHAAKRVHRRTIEEAIEAYSVHLAAEGQRQADGTIYRCKSFFASDLSEPLTVLSPRRCAALYDALCKRPATRRNGGRLVELDHPLSTTSQRGYLTHTRTFLAWCVGEKWIRANPLDAVKPRGKLRHRKEQLRIDEARRWMVVALEIAPRTPGAVAALCAFLLAMRASEIVGIRARDLDDGGRLLWIPESKTEKGRRVLEVPDLLRPLLTTLSEGKSGGDLLFGPHLRGWPLGWTKKICKLAGVPTVCAHSMRGLHSTLAREAGATSHVVAAFLGHASPAITEESYIQPGAGADAATRAPLTVLDGGKKG